MKLKNKRTGEIRDYDDVVFMRDANNFHHRYNSLAELNEEWSDYEEPKGFWLIDVFGIVEYQKTCDIEPAKIEYLKSIGNYFSSKEEAKKAVRKLQAWKRLKDNGFKFESADDFMRSPLDEIWFSYDLEKQEDVYKDICILLGGEE